MTDPFDALRSYAADLRDEVGVERARVRVARFLADPRPAPRPRRALVAVVAAAMVLSNAALALAADPAVPGDALYGVDRAYERVERAVGLGGGHAVERIGEASVLVERGRAAEALDLVREALEGLAEADDPDEARARLDDLVTRSGQEIGVQQEWLERLLTAAHETLEPGERGKEVSDVARERAGDTPAGTRPSPPTSGPPPGGPGGGGPFEEPPGRSGDAPPVPPGQGQGS